MSKKRLGIVIAVVLLIGVMTFGAIGSGAWFTDTETSEDNIFIAGTLDLKVDGQDDPNVVSVSFSNLKPGDVKYVPFRLKNVGTLNGILGIRIKNRVNLENGLEEPEVVAGDTGEPGELGDQLKLTIWHDTIKNGVCDSGEYTWPQWCGKHILNDIPLDYNLFASYTMVAGSEHLIIFRLQFPNLGGVNNMAMGDSVEFDIEFSLGQVH